MASSVQDFKQRTTKAIKLPSGLEVVIRKVRELDFIGLPELPLPTSAEAKTPADIEAWLKQGDNIAKFASVLISKAVIAPPFSNRPEDIDNEKVVHISYLDRADLSALCVEIAGFSGLTKEVAAEAESFRQVEEPAAGS